MENEYTLMQGSCVRGVWSRERQLFVVGEGYSFESTDFSSSTMEVLTEDLQSVQTIELPAPILDVTFNEDIMYISLDAKQGNWIYEYRRTGEWTPIDVGERWQMSEREESTVELYWLENMRKRAGTFEDE
jgi:hypothetical protein